MSQFIAQIADAAARVGATPLTFAAGMALLLFGLAYSWFGKGSTQLKLGVFAALFVMVLVLLWYSYAPPPPAPSPVAVARSDYVVDFQYRGFSKPQAETLRQKLAEKGWVIYGVDAENGFTPTIIKFGASANENAAKALKDDLKTLGAAIAPVRYATDLKIKPTHLELWVGPP